MLPQSLIFATPLNQNQCFYGFAKVEKSSKIDPEGLWNSTFLEVYVELLSFSIFDKILIDFCSILDQFWPPSARAAPGSDGVGRFWDLFFRFLNVDIWIFQL